MESNVSPAAAACELGHAPVRTGSAPLAAPRCSPSFVAYVATFLVEVGPLDACPRTPARTPREANQGVMAANARRGPEMAARPAFPGAQVAPIPAEYSVSFSPSETSHERSRCNRRQAKQIDAPISRG